MRCFAHRGFAGENPENTVVAVERALRAGADGIEVDVRRCASGELVVIHDETVDRVTDQSGRVRDLSLSTLRSLEVLGTGAGVPALADVVATVPPDVVLNVELKETGLAEDLLSTVAASDPSILVSSFEAAALREVAALSDVPLGLLCYDPRDEIETARDLGCEAIHPNERFCDERAVERAHEAGLSVNAWTGRSEQTADRLASAGVDGLIVDAPAYCRR